MKEVLIYNDKGVSEKSFLALKDMFTNIALVKAINSEQVRQGSWDIGCSLFVIPGGRDLPYQNLLQGQGIENIASFVKKGGKFLGICAGAYFACSSIEFAKGTNLEIIEKRDLQFYSGKGVGPVLGNSFSYEDGTGIFTSISYNSGNLNITVPLYYHGGCSFQGKGNLDEVAFYNDHPKSLPAIVRGNHGKGKVLLSGVHFECCLSNKQEDLLRKQLVNDVISYFKL
ncbi:MAG: BPL-N domain-containing protein [Chlamydiota bacterium]|jgi:glutamine amidotransferase-like uncharacterized protein